MTIQITLFVVLGILTWFLLTDADAPADGEVWDAVPDQLGDFDLSCHSAFFTQTNRSLR